jgi:hypothetical protein
MRIHEAKKIIAHLPDSEDVSQRFGALKGTVTAGQLRDMMKGHLDDESVMSNEDGCRVWIKDWKRTKIFIG